MKQMSEQIDLKNIKNILDAAFENFYRLDSELLDYRTEDRAVSERCMVFHIGWYIQNLMKQESLFRDYSIDSEYNRCFEHAKSMYKVTLAGIKEKIGDAIPDLIIHKRKSNAHNLAIFEFKKKGQYERKGRLDDFKKLKYFTDSNNEYKFKYGFWIVLYKKKVDVHVFQNGKELGHLKYTWVK